MMFMICLLLLTVSYNVWSETDYCKSARCRAGSHTMCMFSTSAPGSACNNHKGIMNSKIRKELLDTHNLYRNDIARGKYVGFGPIKNMKQLYWDNELEEIAQRHVDQCKYSHDKCRDVERFEVRQNIGMQSTTDGHQPPQNIFVKDWFDDITDKAEKLEDLYDVIKNFGSRINDSESLHTDSGKMIGPSTAFVMVGTSLVGCGESSYFLENNRYTFFLACNYGPAGNLTGNPAQNKGEACSECPKGTKCGLDRKFPKLCANTDPPSDPSAGSNNTGLTSIRLLALSFLPIFQMKSSIY